MTWEIYRLCLTWKCQVSSGVLSLCESPCLFQVCRTCSVHQPRQKQDTADTATGFTRVRTVPVSEIRTWTLQHKDTRTHSLLQTQVKSCPLTGHRGGGGGRRGRQGRRSSSSGKKQEKQCEGGGWRASVQSLLCELTRQKDLCHKQNRVKTETCTEAPADNNIHKHRNINKAFEKRTVWIDIRLVLKVNQDQHPGFQRPFRVANEMSKSHGLNNDHKPSLSVLSRTWVLTV